MKRTPKKTPPQMKRLVQPHPHENILISFWFDQIKDKKNVESIEYIEQFIPRGAGRFAAAAALKGVRDFFMKKIPNYAKTANVQIDKMVDDTLAEWEKAMEEAVAIGSQPLTGQENSEEGQNVTDINHAKNTAQPIGDGKAELPN